MSDTTTKAKNDKAADRREPPTGSAGEPSVGAAVPIEVTVTQEDSGPGTKSIGTGRRVLPLPMVTLAAEAATTGGVGLYAATGVVGAVAAAGALTTVAVATRVAGAVRNRKAKGGTVARSALPGQGRIQRAARMGAGGGGRAVGGGAAGRMAGGGRSGRGGAVRTGGSGVGSRSGSGGGGAMGKGGVGRAGSKTGARGGPTATGSGFRAGLGSGNAAHRLRRAAGAAGGSAGTRTGAGSSKGAGGRFGSKSGAKSGGPATGSAGGRRGAGAGAGAGAGSAKDAGGGRGSRVAGAATGAGSARGSTAGSAGSGRGPGAGARGALKSTRGAAHRAMTSKAGRLARDRAAGARERVGRAAPKVARKVGAGLAALGVGVLAAVPGLAVSALGAAIGGAARGLLGIGPGMALGKRPLMWGPRAGLWMWRRLTRKARGDVRVLTDFAEPTDVGSVTHAPVRSGADSTGAQMSVFAVRSEAIRDAYARYSPPTMMAVAAEYNGVPQGIRSAAVALYDLATNTADGYPVHPQIADQLASVFTLTMGAAEAADQIEPAFRAFHADDLARHETPRNGEAMWNIGERRAGAESPYQASHFAASCADIESTYSRWAPANMMEVGAEYEGLPTGLDSLAASVRYLAEQSAEAYPVDQRIAETVSETHAFLMRAISAAQDLHPMFRRLHAVDISHHEAPRNGPVAESMWDV